MSTPMMQQFWDAKKRHPGMLLLFRMGDFFELFGEDADVAAKVLGLTLTSRDKTMPMAGFPHHSLENHLHKLLAAGHRVAICDQVEEASQAKGLVKREVTRVVTPGTLTEDNLLDPRRSNHLVALQTHPAGVGLAWLELSTGDFHACDLTAESLRDHLGRLTPSEVLCAEREAGAVGEGLATLQPTPALTTRPDWTFEAAAARSCLERHFKVLTFSGFGFDDGQPCLAAAGALLHYAQEMLKAELVHLRRLQPYHSSRVLHLDEVTRRSLELTRTLRDNQRQGSLLAALDKTVSTMGARLFQEWLLSPLAKGDRIEERLDAVEELAAESSLRGELREALGEIHDVQRLTARVCTGRASPRDLGAIARTLRFLPKVKARIAARKSSLLQGLEKSLELCPDLRQLLDQALVDEPPLSPREGGLVRTGYDAGLDELRDTARGGKEWIARFQAQEIERTGIGSLKVGFNQVFGYYIEITHTHAGKVPANYQRKQTLKNAERYITPELKEYEEKVLGAEDKAKQREYEIFLTIRDQVAAQTSRLLQTGEVLAQLDVLSSLAEQAVSRNYVRPSIQDEAVLEIHEGRHPVLEQSLPPGTFVPNDVILGGQEGLLWLITGPNMSGKSTFIRQVALLTLMAHMGSFVPAKKAVVGLTDRIFTRVGASDELSRGQSTFMVEMTEAANILNNATGRSLVILDEIGRGTSTYDGVSLAWAITEHLHNQLACRALFATHYHELAQLSETLPNLRNYNVLVKEYEGDIVFLHRIEAGSASKSYGIHVARLAGVPSDVVERARTVLKLLESHHLDRELPRARRKKGIAEVQPSLFLELPPARREKE